MDSPALDERLCKLDSGIIKLNGKNFGEVLSFLASGKLSVISLEENALFRMYPNIMNPYNQINEEGNPTRECFIYVPGKGTFLTKHEDFPLLELEVIKSEDVYKRFYPNHTIFDNQLKKALKDSIKIEERKIPTKRFGEEEIIDYAFGSIATDYGIYLKDKGIETIRIQPPTYELGQKSFAQLVWFANTRSTGESQIVAFDYNSNNLRIVKRK